MAEPTEQEQIKQTQVLEEVSKSASDTTGKLDKVIAGLRSVEQESLLADIKEQGEEKVKSDKEHHNKQITAITGLTDIQADIIEQGEDRVESDERLQESVEDFARDSSEADKKDEAQNKFVKDQEKKKEGLAKMSFSFTQRAAKLATRAGKGALDWGKDKVKTVTRAVGSFFENLLKLLALLGLWFALSWLKGKDLKKMFEDFMKTVNQFIDDWIPQWIQDLSIGEAIGVAIAAFVGGWLLLKGAIATAGWALRRTGARMTEALGTKSGLNKQLIRMQTKLADLVAKKNAITRTRKMATSLEAKSILDEQLRKTNEKIAEVERNINEKKSAIDRGETMGDKLKEKSVLEKQLKKANTALEKASGKSSAIAESIKWGENLDTNSRVGKKLLEANTQLEKAIAEQRATEQAVRKNIAERNAIKAGKEIHIMKEGQWIDKRGVIHEGGKPVGGKGTGIVVPKAAGGGTVDIKEKGVTVGERIGGYWERFKTSIGAGMDKVGEAKVGGTKLKNIAKAGGWLADMGWRLTKILEPLRGAVAGFQEGEGFVGTVTGTVAGGVHGISDLAASVVGFFGQVGKLAEEGGMRGIGMLAGQSEAQRDRMVKEWQGHEWNLFNKSMTLLQDTDEAWQKGNNALFGQWKEGTKLHELVQSKMGTKEGFSLMDIVGLGDKGGLEGIGNFWKSYFELRQEDVGEANEIMAKATIKQRDKWKKEGSVNWMGIGVKPVDPDTLMSTIIMKNVIDPLVAAIENQQALLQKQLASIGQSGGNVTFVGGNAETVVIAHRQEKDPMDDILN